MSVTQEASRISLESTLTESRDKLWVDARPKYNRWRIGVIRVDVLASEVTAKWVEDNNFKNCKLPTETEVTHRLTTQGDGLVIQTVDEPSKRTKQGQKGKHGR
jgi:hypothetical protein